MSTGLVTFKDQRAKTAAGVLSIRETDTHENHDREDCNNQDRKFFHKLPSLTFVFEKSIHSLAEIIYIIGSVKSR